MLNIQVKDVQLLPSILIYIGYPSDRRGYPPDYRRYFLSSSSLYIIFFNAYKNNIRRLSSGRYMGLASSSILDICVSKAFALSSFLAADSQVFSKTRLLKDKTALEALSADRFPEFFFHKRSNIMYYSKFKCLIAAYIDWLKIYIYIFLFTYVFITFIETTSYSVVIEY